MHFIAMIMIGKFKPVPQGHLYTLTVINMLMNYAWCIQLHTKEAVEFVYTYLVNAYSNFGGSHKFC